MDHLQLANLLAVVPDYFCQVLTPGHRYYEVKGSLAYCVFFYCQKEGIELRRRVTGDTEVV